VTVAAKVTRRKPGRRSGPGGARKGAGRPKGAKTRDRAALIRNYDELGDAPVDELEGIKWAFRANAVALREIMRDKKLSPEKRRAEIRTISRTMNALLPKARLRRAEAAVRGEAAAIERKVDPLTEPVPEAHQEPARGAPRHPAAPAAELEPVPAEPPKETP
jgi:hypothetical protein